MHLLQEFHDLRTDGIKIGVDLFEGAWRRVDVEVPGGDIELDGEMFKPLPDDFGPLDDGDVIDEWPGEKAGRGDDDVLWRNRGLLYDGYGEAPLFEYPDEL